VVTGSRSEYGLLKRLIWLIHQSDQLSLRLVITGSHLSKSHGFTLSEIKADGFDIAAQVRLSIEQGTSIAELTAEAIQGFALVLNKLQPQAVVLLGDRYETFGASVAAHFAGIPIAHIHGGETTEGALDDALRHCITHFSTWHFTAAIPYLDRVLAMGADPSRSHCVGPLVLDALREPLQLTREQFENQTGYRFSSRNWLITYHPETLAPDFGVAGLIALLTALEVELAAASRNLHILITGANADPAGREIMEILQRFQQTHAECCWFLQSLGQQRYLAALNWFDAVIGNSSSGIIEAPMIGIPVLNIGNRQKGRLRFGDVQDVPPNADDILSSLRSLKHKKQKSQSMFRGAHHESPAAQICRIIESELPSIYCRDT
jgi:UDP-hydrolysing UDP-N-acetyl-D-glucosamine 2-epimerase